VNIAIGRRPWGANAMPRRRATPNYEHGMLTSTLSPLDGADTHRSGNVEAGFEIGPLTFLNKGCRDLPIATIGTSAISAAILETHTEQIKSAPANRAVECPAIGQ
jgi:hypothetical protein